MDEAHKELVTYIRSVHEWCARTKSGGDWFAIDPDESPFKAADALEALAGEVERLSKAHDERLQQNTLERAATHKQFHRAESAEAERNRLAGEVGRYKAMLKDFSATFTARGTDLIDTSSAMNQMTKRAEAAESERDRLKAALVDAKEMVISWGSYAPTYFAEKHDLLGDVERLNKALGDAS